jgi:hypothetical protein
MVEIKHHNSNPIHLCSANNSLSVFICQHWVLKPRAAPSSILSVASNVVGPVHPSIPYFYVAFIYCVKQTNTQTATETLE